MEVAIISAARWVVDKALDPLKDDLLRAWADSKKLGPNVDALKTELLCTQATLDSAQERDVHSSALEELLLKLRQLAYDADDVLDELDYFRIQDTLDGTYHAANVHAGGCAHGLVLNARHTARSAISKLKISACSRDASRGDLDGQGDDAKQGCLSAVFSCGGQEISSTPPPPANQGNKEVDGGCMTKAASSARNAAHAIGKHFPCYSFQSVHDDAHPSMLESSSNIPGSRRRFLCSAWTSKALQRNHVVQTPKLKFNRVEISRKMEDIVEQLKPLRANVSSILNLLPNRTTTMKRPQTTPAIIEPKLFGRDSQIKSIADRITHGEYCDKELTVLAIVGPGGIGKTTFTQHLYEEVKSHFQVPIWICVSLNFNANRLAQEIVKKIPKVNGEKENCSEEELIAQRLQSKRFLLVLDDMWTYHEEWRKLLAPFRKAGTGGNMVIVTTRFPKVAKKVGTVDHLNLERLSPEDIMRLFEAWVFGDQQPWKDHEGLREVGGEIVARLKGFPLAAKTVGRLLSDNLTLEHWTEVLDNKEWELEKSDDDIMPALKLSYDYLPFHLQQCFSYCALFPEDHEFDSKELIHFWIGQNILRSGGQNKSIEDIGLSNLNELVTHGFFKKEETHGRPCYLIHDLLHDLSLKVASHECVSVARSNVRSVQIRPSVRHLSIIMDNADDNDGMTDENFRMELRKLKKRLKIENLQTLMIFGELDESFAGIFGYLFREANALRVLSLPEMSYPVESMLHNFSEFVHLRYLRLMTWFGSGVHLPSTLSRFYHLRILDLQNWVFHTQDRHDLPRGMSNLVKLRHFLTHDGEVHSAISNVGKLQFLQELRKFLVNKENSGFELKQLGHLIELRELGIYNLEKIHTKEEAAEAKLVDKNHLLKLTLEWESNGEPDSEALVLESLRPQNNLQELRIRGHGGPSCPSWLGHKLSVKALKSLHLVGVAWKILPPLGQMWVLQELTLEGIATLNEFDPSQFGRITEQSFHHLKRLKLIGLEGLKKWVVGDVCHLFSGLHVLIIRNCHELSELPFMNTICYPPKHDENICWLPNLQEFEIEGCPKVLTLPPIPWTPTLCSVKITNSLCQLNYSKSSSEVRLYIEGTNNLRSLDEVVSFNSLTELRVLEVHKCPTLESKHLPVLTSLKKLIVLDGSINMFVPLGSLGDVEWQLPIEFLGIWGCTASGKELTQLLSHLPKLADLSIEVEQQQRTGPVSWPSSLL